MMPGNPSYWQETHEPLNLQLDQVVRGLWTDEPPVADRQLQFIPHYAGKHCLQSVRVSRLANEGGAHAVAVGLLRDAVEALSVVALSISHHSDKISLLQQWDAEKLSAGQVRQVLEQDVWPSIGAKGLWDESWSSFWADLARAVQPYAHFSPPRMRWHQHIRIVDGKWHFWINNPQGDFELYRAARVVAFQLVVFWAFAELVQAFRSAPQDELRSLKAASERAKNWLSSNEVFFSGASWSDQLIPFVYPADPQYWPDD